MKFRDLESPDKTMYRLAMIISVINIICISYVILLSVMMLFNSIDHSKILINANLYNGFYDTFNFLSAMLIPLFFIAFFGAIPYIVFSIVVFVFFIIRYIKYKNRNIIKMIISLLVFGIVVFLVLEGIIICTKPGKHELNINSKISEISNKEVKTFITEKMTAHYGSESYNRILKEDYYIYDVIVYHDFRDTYKGVIHYEDNGKTEKSIGINGRTDFINNNMIDKSEENMIKAVLLWIAGEGIYIGLITFTQKDLNSIAKRKETIDFEKNENRIKTKKIIIYTLIIIFFVVIISSIIFILAHPKTYKSNINDPNILYQKEINKGEIIRVIKLDTILAQRTVVGIEKSVNGGKSFIRVDSEGITVHNGAEFCFINNDIGFINDYGIVGTDGDNRTLKVTTDGGRTFKDVNIIHPDNIEEDNLFVDGVPYKENGSLKLQVYTLNHENNSEKTYYTFYGHDNGVNWSINR